MPYELAENPGACWRRARPAVPDRVGVQPAAASGPAPTEHQVQAQGRALAVTPDQFGTGVEIFTTLVTDLGVYMS